MHVINVLNTFGLFNQAVHQIMAAQGDYAYDSFAWGQ